MSSSSEEDRFDSDSRSSHCESFGNADEQSDQHYLPYDSEPLASEVQAAAHEQERVEEDEEMREFSSRFSRENPTSSW